MMVLKERRVEKRVRGRDGRILVEIKGRFETSIREMGDASCLTRAKTDFPETTSHPLWLSSGASTHGPYSMPS